MSDRLVSLLSHFELQARVFHTGTLCSNVRFDAAEGVGYVHVVRHGSMKVSVPGAAVTELNAPSLIFYGRPTTHRLQPADDLGVELVCGSIDFGAGADNPLSQALPGPLVIPLAGQQGLSGTLDLLFAEAFSEACGRQAALDRLCELLVILLLRLLMDRGEADVGLLAGLADPRLANALNAIHDQPAYPWRLEELAERAYMSRSRFAINFRNTIGMTPGEYLAQWRLRLAKSLLRRGHAVTQVAHEVGYSGPAALTRAFKGQFGLSPREWLKEVQATA